MSEERDYEDVIRGFNIIAESLENLTRAVESQTKSIRVLGERIEKLETEE